MCVHVYVCVCVCVCLAGIWLCVRFVQSNARVIMLKSKNANIFLSHRNKFVDALAELCRDNQNISSQMEVQTEKDMLTNSLAVIMNICRKFSLVECACDRV